MGAQGFAAAAPFRVSRSSIIIRSLPSSWIR